MANELTPKQARFVDEYIIDLNAKQAAIRAGYSEYSAEAQGSTLLSNPKVALAIQERKDQRRSSREELAQMVIDHLKSIAFSDPRDLMTWVDDDMVLKPSKDLTPEQAKLVSEVKAIRFGGDTGGGSVSIKTVDRMKAVELLGKHLGLFVDRVAVSQEESPLDELRRRLDD